MVSTIQRWKIAVHYFINFIIVILYIISIIRLIFNIHTTIAFQNLKINIVHDFISNEVWPWRFISMDVYIVLMKRKKMYNVCFFKNGINALFISNMSYQSQGWLRDDNGRTQNETLQSFCFPHFFSLRYLTYVILHVL